MNAKKEAMTIRTKIIGVLLRNARLEMGKTADDCAHVLNCAPAVISAYEYGHEPISLPVLELLAEYLHKRLDYFWAEEPFRAEKPRATDDAMAIRDRIIGVQLRQARQTAGKAIQDCAQLLGRTPVEIEQYEYGHASVPIAELETLANFLNVPITHFFVAAARPPMPPPMPTAELPELPPKVRDFVTDPANLPYLELAQHLPAVVHAWQQITK